MNGDYSEAIKNAQDKFGELLKEQLARVEKMAVNNAFVDYTKLESIIIGITGGDGIGPAITAQAQRAMEFLLKDEVAAGKIRFKAINGLTIENRIAEGRAIPEKTLEELKSCHVILKGPTDRKSVV